MRRRHISAHARIWLLLAALLPAILVLALVARGDGPAEAPRRLSAP
jgi:hypothetical protein